MNGYKGFLQGRAHAGGRREVTVGGGNNFSTSGFSTHHEFKTGSQAMGGQVAGGGNVGVVTTHENRTENVNVDVTGNVGNSGYLDQKEIEIRNLKNELMMKEQEKLNMQQEINNLNLSLRDQQTHGSYENNVNVDLIQNGKMNVQVQHMIEDALMDPNFQAKLKQKMGTSGKGVLKTGGSKVNQEELKLQVDEIIEEVLQENGLVVEGKETEAVVDDGEEEYEEEVVYTKKPVRVFCNNSYVSTPSRRVVTPSRVYANAAYTTNSSRVVPIRSSSSYRAYRGSDYDLR